MKALWEIFLLEWRGLVRSRTLAMLSIASVVWMFAAPHVFRADGTAEGAREMCVRFSLGGVTALLAIALLVSAAGAISRERAAKRLQLTMVRPVRLFALALGKIAALAAVGALVLALAATIEAFRQDPSRTCNSVYRPVLPSPEEEARRMYDVFMADPGTPDYVRKAPKDEVLSFLAQRAYDHYQTVGTNTTAAWTFPIDTTDATKRFAMRFRFTNMYNMRDEVKGILQTPTSQGFVSNITQAVVAIPLAPRAGGLASPCGQPDEVRFSNLGTRAVMLRPRRDVELLVRSDGFRANLVRAYLQLVGMLTLLVAFGVFLGACLSRPVAVFVAVVALALSEMSPSIVERGTDSFSKDRSEAIGLAVARFSAAVTHPVGSLNPLASLAADDRIEPREVVRTMLADAIVIPIVLALLAAFLMPRKQDEL